MAVAGRVSGTDGGITTRPAPGRACDAFRRLLLVWILGSGPAWCCCCVGWIRRYRRSCCNAWWARAQQRRVDRHRPDRPLWRWPWSRPRTNSSPIIGDSILQRLSPTVGSAWTVKGCAAPARSSQQVARNLFSMAGAQLRAQGAEVWFTGLIELAWPKHPHPGDVSEFAETGAPVGVAVTSRHYFDRSGRLGRQKAALLAAVLPNPVVSGWTAHLTWYASGGLDPAARWTTSVAPPISTRSCAVTDVASPRPVLITRCRLCPSCAAKPSFRYVPRGIRAPGPVCVGREAIVIATVCARPRSCRVELRRD